MERNLERLLASINVAARENGFNKRERRRAVMQCVGGYRALFLYDTRTVACISPSESVSDADRCPQQLAENMNTLAIAILALTTIFAVPAFAQDKPADNMQTVRDKVRADKKLLVAESMHPHGKRGQSRSVRSTTAITVS